MGLDVNLQEAGVLAGEEYKKIANAIAADTGQPGAERQPGERDWVPPPARDTIGQHLRKLDTRVPSDPPIPLLDAEHREAPCYPHQMLPDLS